MNHPKIIVLTGRFGSGKRTALAALEDSGFYCVDNMPITLVPEFLKLAKKSSKKAGFAFVMDLRDDSFLSKYPEVFAELKNAYSLKIIFLDADEKTLLQRFKQTRRPHPLANGKNLIESIQLEARLMADLKKMAMRVIDTSASTVHELRFLILKIAKEDVAFSPMAIQVMSFGFKYGIPMDADLIIDVRFLSNPYFVPDLKELDGTCEKIKSYVLNNKETSLFLQKYIDLLDYLIPLYEKEGKAYLTIAVGCTGGRHRSVVIANTISEHIIKMQSQTRDKIHKQITTTHRDIGHSS